MTDYFVEQRAEVYFARHLPPPCRGTFDVLQLGAFLGSASEWLHARYMDAYVIDVDTWSGPGDEGVDWAAVEAEYDRRCAGWLNHAKIKSTTDEFFSGLRLMFDFVYVDADHTFEAVCRDAGHSWAVLRPGGILAFDDYSHEPVRRAVNRFVADLDPGFTVLDDGRMTRVFDSTLDYVPRQFWMRKDRL